MTYPGKGPGHLILIINHILLQWRGQSDIWSFRSKTVQRGVVFNHIDSAFNASIVAWIIYNLGPFCLPRSGEASMVSGSEILASCLALLNYMDITIKTIRSVQLPLPINRLSYRISRSLDVFNDDPSKILPPNIPYIIKWPTCLYTKPNLPTHYL